MNGMQFKDERKSSFILSSKYYFVDNTFSPQIAIALVTISLLIFANDCTVEACVHNSFALSTDVTVVLFDFTLFANCPPKASGVKPKESPAVFVREVLSVFQFNAEVPTFFIAPPTSNAKSEPIDKAVSKIIFFIIFLFMFK